MEERKHTFRLRRLRALQLLTYVAARSVIAVVCMFSPSFVERIGRFLGRLMYLVDGKHRKIAHKNLTRSDGWPKDARQQGRFIRRVYEHFGTCLVENLMLPKLVHGRRLLERTRLERFDILDRQLADGRGCICVIAHLGNWEWAGLAVSLSGYPLNSVARPVENPWIDRYLNRFRALTGQRIIPKYGAVRAMNDVLRRGGMLVILADQDARHGGIFIPFFGRPASTIKSPALLALRHRKPIVPVNIWRDREGVHHARFSEPIAPDPGLPHAEAVRSLTERMNARFEEFVREHPTQWMWLHARWKTAGRVLREAAERGSAEEGDEEPEDDGVPLNDARPGTADDGRRGAVNDLKRAT